MRVTNKPANREEAIRIRAAILDGKKMGDRFSYVTTKSKQVATKMINNEHSNNGLAEVHLPKARRMP